MKLTCRCLMVSPPFPMTRPTLLAGIKISWTALFPSIWLWKPGPFRHRSTICPSNLLACLIGQRQQDEESRNKENRRRSVKALVWFKGRWILTRYSLEFRSGCRVGPSFLRSLWATRQTTETTSKAKKITSTQENDQKCCVVGSCSKLRMFQFLFF